MKTSQAYKVYQITITFLLVSFAWIFFRANNLTSAFDIIGNIITNPGIPFFESVNIYVYGLLGLGILLLKEFHNEHYPTKYRFFESENPILAAFASSLVIVLILSIGVFDGGQFIYFQF